MVAITKPGRFIVFIGSFVVLIYALLWIFFSANAAVQKSGTFEIAIGQSARSVWSGLEAQGFVRGTVGLRYYSWRFGAENTIQAGTYQLETGESLGDVVQRFIAGDVLLDELTVTYPEGFTLQQIAARTASRDIGTEETFIETAKSVAFAEEFPWLQDIPAGRSLEGYLFPDTYRVFGDDTPEDVVKRMLANFSQKITSDVINEALANGRTLDEIIIMASMIEREVTSDDDMAMVSGILWQRLADDTGLGADATVRYVLNKWEGALTVEDLAVDSPYNTRRYAGLPPGPISNPGLRAIMAAIRPEASDYYYYLSTPSGETIFSETNEEHNANKAKYLK